MRQNQLVGGGGFLFLVGLLAFFPPMFDRQLLILAWLGSWSQPVGLSAMVVGGLLWSIGKLQDLRDRPATGSADVTFGGSSGDAGPAANVGVGQAAVVQPNVLSGQAPVSPDPTKRG
jgi:hypothetical protein